MIKIHFSKHLIHRANIRNIKLSDVKKIVLRPENMYFDSLNETKIALGKQKSQIWMVAYIKDANKIIIVTTHPIKQEQIDNRLKSKRWARLK